SKTAEEATDQIKAAIAALASMGPRSKTAEELSLSLDGGRTFQLQWGRGRRPRKSPVGCSFQPVGAQLQWGRGRRPRKSDRFSRAVAPIRCFNGAAVEDRG